MSKLEHRARDYNLSGNNFNLPFMKLAPKFCKANRHDETLIWELGIEVDRMLA